MPYTMRDLAERSGLAPRTLRSYAMEGLIPRADGRGPGAKYSEEHMVRAVAIGRMRARGVGIGQILDDVEGWSTARFAQYVAQTDPPPKPAAPAPASSEPPAVEGERVPAEDVPLLGAEGGARRARGAGMEVAEDGELPDAAAWSIYPLLSGMALMVDIDAPEAVRRLAKEILGKYGARRRRNG
jgi:DNA-binding transcriptional MerR regulator